MVIGKLVEVLLLQSILADYTSDNEYRKFLKDNYDVNKIQERYLALGEEYLKQYALNKTEKSE